jgi:hypothetical protein
VPVKIEEVILEEIPEETTQKSEVITESTPAETANPEATEIFEPGLPQVSETKLEVESAPIRLTSAEIKKIEIPLPTPVPMPTQKSEPIAPVAEKSVEEDPVRLRANDLKKVEQKTLEPKTPVETVVKRIQSETPKPIEEVKTRLTERNLASESPPKPMVAPEVQPVLKTEDGKNQSENRGSIQVKVGSSFLKYEGIDPSDGSRATLGSSSAFRVGLDWITLVRENSSLSFGMNLQKVEIMELSDFAIQGASQSLLEIHSEYRTLLTNELGFLIRAGQRDHLVYRALSVSTIKIDKIPILYANFELSREFRVSPFLFATLRGGFVVHAPVQVDSYQSKLGTGFSGAFRWSQQFKTISLFAEPFYQKDVIPLEGLDYTESELGLAFGISVPLN